MTGTLSAPAGESLQPNNGRDFGRDRSFQTVAVLASVMAAAIAAVYWSARIGFDNPIGPIAKSLALTLFFINAPYCARWIIRRRTSGYWWATSYSFLWLATLAILGIAGRLVPLTGVNPFFVFAAIGTAGFAVILARWLFSGRPLRSAVLLTGSLAFGIWAAGVVWGRIYKSPLFLEMMALDGVVHHDGLGLAALGNMLRTYNVASVGLDGLPDMAYHWGTPWLFAQLSNLLGMSVLEFYQLAFPVMMIPFFFGGVLAFAAEVRNVRPQAVAAPGDRNSDARFWAIFLAASVGVIPITAMDALGVWTSNVVISESYTVAVPVALLLLSLTVVLWYGGGREALERGHLDRASGAFLLLVLGPGLIALGYLKISLMILGFLLVAYFGVRLGLYRRPVFLAFGFVLAILVAFTYGQVSLPAHREGLSPLDFLKQVVPPVWWPFFPFVHLFWSLLYVALRLNRSSLRTLADVVRGLREGRLFDVEAVTLVALAGIAPGLILHINGGSAFYFSDVQRWLAVGFLLAGLPLLLPAASSARTATGAAPGAHAHASAARTGSRITLANVALAFLAIPLVLSMLGNGAYWTRRMLWANAETRAGLYSLASAPHAPPRIAGLPALADESTLRSGLRAGRNTAVLDGLLQLGRLPLEERRATALFIPQTERRYWEILSRPGACTFAPHVAPALTGMALIDGMPATECELTPYYGVGAYKPRARAQLPRDTLPAVLCDKARSAGLSRVMSLHFDKSGRMIPAVIQCR